MRQALQTSPWAAAEVSQHTELLELPLHQKLTSLRAGAEVNVVSAGRLMTSQTVGCVVNYSDFIADRYLHLLPLHQRKSHLQGARQLGTVTL